MSEKDKPSLSIEEEEIQVLAIAKAHSKMVWMVLAVVALIVAFQFYPSEERENDAGTAEVQNALKTDSTALPLDTVSIPVVDSLLISDTTDQAIVQPSV